MIEVKQRRGHGNTQRVDCALTASNGASIS
jgi:hypothetical protein